MGCSFCCQSKKNQKSVVIESIGLSNQALKQFLKKYPQISETYKTLPQWSPSPDKTEISLCDEGIYMGTLASHSKNGEGIMLYHQDGFFYEGSWVNDFKEGKGRLIYKNGHYYQGMWKKDQPYGEGVYVSPEPYWRYEGDWVDGRQHGKGKEIFDDGSYYEGEWINGLKSGKGNFVNSSRDYFKGEFQDGQPHGYGKMKDSGYIYVGEWGKGRKNGAGKSEWLKDGQTQAVYIGQYKDNKKHGYGEYKWRDEKVFKGKWEQGEMKQAGVLINFQEQKLKSSKKLPQEQKSASFEEKQNNSELLHTSHQ